MIINEEEYPWLKVHDKETGNGHILDWFGSDDAIRAISEARDELRRNGAVKFPRFVRLDVIEKELVELRRQADNAFTTDDAHTAYLKSPDLQKFPSNSVYNHEMKTHVASTAYDELSNDSILRQLYHDPRLLKLVSLVSDRKLYLSEDPLGCCSVNVFRPGYHHSFHYDESEISVTLMLQPAEDPESGLFQYSEPLRRRKNYSSDSGEKDGDDLALVETARLLHKYDQEGLQGKVLDETKGEDDDDGEERAGGYVVPALHTLDFVPGTLLILAGSKSLHRVTKVRGSHSRLVAVLTFSSQPGFCNTKSCQEMFWGRSSTVSTSLS